MRRAMPWFAGGLGCLAITAWAADAPLAYRERAVALLAAGNAGGAADELARGVAATGDPDGALRCLRVAALRRAGRDAAAIEAAAEVPADAACAPRARFAAADALLALGRAEEAAAAWEADGAARLGVDRDARSAEALVRLAEERLGEDDPERAAEILDLALQMQIAPERSRAIATRLGELAVARGVSGLSAGRFLQRALGRADDPATRRLIARLDPSIGAAVLGPLALDPETVAADVDVALALGDPARAVQQADPAASTPDRRKALALAASELGWLAAGERWLTAWAMDPDQADEAGLRQVELIGQGSDPGRYVDALDAWLGRFPGAPQRGDVEHRRALALLSLGRERAVGGDAASALVALDRATGVPDVELAANAAWEAGVVSRESGDRPEAARRWKEAAARWPGTTGGSHAIASLARLTAFDEGTIDAAKALLEEQTGDGIPGAAEELARFEEPDLAVVVDGRQSPGEAVAHVWVRNLAEVEVRLHQIDPEAFLRQGKRPGDLEQLDVAVIAPDRQWTVPVPGGASPEERELVVALPNAAGLWAVTAASPDREAHALALVSDVVGVARQLGPDLVVSAFEGDQPLRGARVLATGPNGVVEGKTDGTGVWRTHGSAEVAVLITTPRGVSLVDLTGGEPVAEPARAVAVDLDRAVYRPGDDLGFRLVARQGDRPIRGRWRVTAEIAGFDPTSVEVELDPRGLAIGSLPLSPRPVGGLTGAVLVAGPVGESPTDVARFGVADVDPAQRLARVVSRDGHRAIDVAEPDGSPAVGVPVRWEDPDGTERRGVTDAVGRVPLPDPPPGLAWHPNPRVAPGGAEVAELPEAAPRISPLTLSIAQPILRPSEAPAVTLGGDGPVTLLLTRVTAPPESPEPLPDPWVPARDTGLVWETTPRVYEVRGAHEVVWSREVRAGEDLTLEPVSTEGDFRLWAIPRSGKDTTATVDFRVSARALRITGARNVQIGESLSLGVEGGSALLLVEGAGVHAAATADGPGDLPFTPGPAAATRLVVVAISPTGERVEQAIWFTRDLQVALTSEQTDGIWTVTATVTDGAGRPARAQVALRATDLALEAVVGRPTLATPTSVFSRFGVGDAAVGARWADGGEAVVLDSELLAEATRERESLARRNAMSSGILASKQEMGLLSVVTDSFSGLSGYGSGAGGGGYGSGLGGVGTKGHRGGGVGRVAPAVAGVRERVLWAVLEADAGGVVRWTAPAPLRSAGWRISANAFAEGAFGQRELLVAEREVDVSLPHAEPAHPGDVARPVARIANRGRSSAQVAIGGQEHLVPAGASLAIPLPEVGAGSGLDLTATVDGVRIWQGRWELPLAPGVPSADGPVHTRGGAAALALEPDVLAATDPVRAAIAGRSVLAVLAAGEAREPELERALQRHAAVVVAALQRGELPTSQVDRAEMARFLGEARKVLGLPTDRLDSAEAALGAPPDASGRLAVAVARTALGKPIDEAAIAWLIRTGATFDDADASRLAVLLAGLDRKAEARSWVRGTGPEAAVARILLGEKPSDPGPVALGVRGRAERIAVLAHLGASGPLERDLTGPGDRSGPPPAGDRVARVLRGPRTADGPPAQPEGAPWRGPWLECGNPCRLGVGEIAWTPASMSVSGSGGMARVADRTGGAWIATLPGRFTIHGRVWEGERWQPTVPLVFEVVASSPDPTGMDGRLAIAGAEIALERGEDPSPWLADAGGHPELATRLPRIRFDDGLRRGVPPADQVARFEDLRIAAPDAELSSAEIALIAKAYRDAGRPDRAVAVWRAGVGAAFLGEFAGVRRVDQAAGPLVALRQLRDLVGRSPPLAAVEEAAFHLPEQLGALADQPLPAALRDLGVTPTDLRLQAAAWDREFLALHPDAEQAPEVAFRLARLWLDVGAPQRAADLAAEAVAAHPDHPLRDALEYLEGLAATDLGQDARALERFRRLSTELYPLGDGTLGVPASRPDAQLAIARVYEARGNTPAARLAYAAVDDPEARASKALLDRALLTPTQPIQVLATGKPATLALRVANQNELAIRAYRIDLRTIFLRDRGLAGALDTQLAGVSPAWAGDRKVAVGPFPEEISVPLPLSGSGAWLVQLSGGGLTANALVVRSDLSLQVDAGTGVSVVAVRRGGKPAAGVEVRAVRGGIEALQTDVRGIARVSRGSSILVFSGDDVAFSLDQEPEVLLPDLDWVTPGKESGRDDAVNARLRSQRESNLEFYEENYGREATGELPADRL